MFSAVMPGLLLHFDLSGAAPILRPSLNMANTPESSEILDVSNPPSTATKWSHWGKRAGTLAFLFFFVKGLAWLVVPVALATWWAK